MTPRLRTSSEMKDSGIEWLGEIPAHWTVLQLGQLGRLFKGAGGTKDDETETGIPCIRYGDLYTQHEFHITKSWSCVNPETAASRYTPIHYGDVLFAGSGETIEEIGKSAANLIDGPACCGGDLIVFRPSARMDARFLGYASDCPSAAHQKATLGRGITVMHIYGGELKYLRMALPTLSEQAKIARFLDHSDRRIRRAIRAKEKMIALLEEQKQALIHDAVTGRTDVRTGQPYPTYKDSGVEWLGEVPEHWEVGRLKALLCPVDRRSNDGKETLLSLRRDHGVVIYAEHFAHPPQARSLVGYKLVRAGELVVNRLQANNGLVFNSTLNGLVSPDYSVFESKVPVQMRYLSDLLRTPVFRAHFRRQSTGLGTGTAGFLRVYDDDFLGTRVGLPSIDEQAAIVAHLDDATSTFARATELLRSQIERLKEYRTRLIADVVTGKLDVREAAASLPDEDAAPAGEEGHAGR